MRNRYEVVGQHGTLHVAELARTAGVTPATVRYYARTGLLQPNRDPGNTYRQFTRQDLRRLQFIRRAQYLGLTIADIKDILSTIGHGENPCLQVRLLVEQRLQSIREHIVELRATEQRILEAMAVWKQVGGENPADGEICPLIDRVDVVASNRNMP